MQKILAQLKQLQQRFYHLLQQHVIAILMILLGVGFGLAVAGTHWLSTNLVISQARHHASVAVKTLNHARQLYSKDVVGRVQSLEEVTVSAKYHSIYGGIPNPATYTIELGELLSDKNQGMLFRLYSDYPFPNRKDDGGGPQDQFEIDALNYLRDNPSESFQREEVYENRWAMRYTEAIQMEASCVACHNALSYSPKKDWRVGDVRGVVEIVQPLDEIMIVANDGLKTISVVLGSILALAIAGITIVVSRFRLVNQELETKVAERTFELEQLATTDSLTQIANRGQFQRTIEEEWQRTKRLQQPLSVILCDVDFFKRYNDTYGHQAGDDCLYSVAQVLQSHAQRAGDLAARYGGEEFILVLPNTRSDQAQTVATLIRTSIHQLAILHEASEAAPHVTLSMGIATVVPHNEFSTEQFIKEADDTLYQAKETGRDQFVAVNINSEETNS